MEIHIENVSMGHEQEFWKERKLLDTAQYTPWDKKNPQ